jgi:hypothetical protein
LPDPDASARTHAPSPTSWCLALAAAGLFLLLSAPRIDRQGFYYDELHQATAAFAYRGLPAPMFNAAQILGIPVLNMPYSGALKTGLYGLYLRLTGAPFTVASWRWLGLVLVAGGLAMFVLIATPGVPLGVIALITAFVITDRTVLITTRHDFGPSALSLALRLVLLALLIRRGAAGPGPREAGWLGLLTGLVVFEKLSGVVLVAPLAAIVAISGSGSARRRAKAFGIGLLLGMLPLAYLNPRSWLVDGTIISLSVVPEPTPQTWPEFISFAWRYLTLGWDAEPQEFVFGHALPWSQATEGMTMALMLSAVTVCLLRNGTAVIGRPRLVGMLLLAWLVVGLEVFLLPTQTAYYHWMLGTPFQYTAIGLALMPGGDPAHHARRTSPRILVLVAILFLASRVPGLIGLEYDLWRGAASSSFNPSLTRLGELAAHQPDDVLFVAGDWGVATQILCLSNGRSDLVDEAFWSYGGDGRLPGLLARHPEKRVFYLVTPTRASGVAPDQTRLILEDFDSGGAITPVPIASPFSALDGLRVRAYVRR